MSDRRASAAPPPPPPPLPPPQKLNAFARFVQPFTAYGSRPPSAQANRVDTGKASPLLPRITGIASHSSQDASHRTGLDISALDVNHERTHAILAGREILKTIRVTGTRCAEEDNLRAAIINYSSHSSTGTGTSTRHRENLEIHDVKWSHGSFSSYIATAATNGKVILYDLNRSGVELARLHEHHRQVHKLAFNPHQGYLLLSGSQDATVRLWDLRDLRKEIMTCPSRDKYSGLSEGIRDLKWSPTDGVEFAFGTDNGVIQRWDFLYNRGPKLKINAHDKACTSVDWHPDGKHLISAGTDKTVKVWDFSSEARRQKPGWTIRTPYPVWRALWRPSCWITGNQDSGIFHCTQIATSYDREHPVVHLWDFRRPYLPFREIPNARYKTAPTDMLWHSRDLLWTVGKEGMFTQTDVHFSPKILDRRNLQAFALSPYGELTASVQKRSRYRDPNIEYTPDEIYSGDGKDKRTSPEKSSFGRSSADDSLDNSFLSSSLKRHHGRTYSNRSTKSFGSTPPLSDAVGKVSFLDHSIAMHKDISQPNQVAFRGLLAGSLNIQIFSYLAQKYKAVSLPDPPTLESYQALEGVFEQNAEYAQRAGFYRLAEIWRTVGLTTHLASSRRAKERKTRRVEQARKEASTSKVVQNLDHINEDASYRNGPINPAMRALLGTDIYPQIESTSNLTTPLARPVSALHHRPGANEAYLPDPDHAERLKLPPSMVGVPALDLDDTMVDPKDSTKPRKEVPEPQRYANSSHAERRRELINNWRSHPRPLLELAQQNPESLSITIPPPLDRHNSEDSFAMFSASTDSRHGFSIPSSYASGVSQPHSVESTSANNHWQDSNAGSSFGNTRAVQQTDESNGPDDSQTTESLPPQMTTSDMRNHTGLTAQNSKSVREGNNSNSLDNQAQFNTAVHHMNTLRKQNQLFRHDSSESEAFLSSKGSFSFDTLAYIENMEASGTIVPDVPHDDMRSPRSLNFPSKRESVNKNGPAMAKVDNLDESTVLADYQTTGDDSDLEAFPPFSMIDLLKNLLEFHTVNLSDAQTPSVLLLLLAPLLPRNQSLPESTKESISSVYVDCMVNLGMSPMQIETILQTNINSLLETGINPLQAESILDTYHTQLHSLGLFTAASSLRRLAYPTYPAVYEQALKETQLGFLCQKCNHPINNPRDKTHCETCKAYASPCPICWSRLPAFETPGLKKKGKGRRASRIARVMTKPPLSRNISVSSQILTNDPSSTSGDAIYHDLAANAYSPTEAQPVLYNWCPVCGHGGHAACMTTWFGDPLLSEGACPVQGCLCDCVKGKRRDERMREMTSRTKEAQVGRVRGDDWKVSESRAVGVVRGAMLAEKKGEIGGSDKGEARRVRLVEPRK